MAGHGIERPAVSGTLLRLFTRYTKWYLRRNFHAVRISGSLLPAPVDGYPVVVCANHPSWWDPLVALTLAVELMPARTHYAPIDQHALEKYKFFEKLGFFGIDPHRTRGAAKFLRIGSAILADRNSALWVTAQGTFADARLRPVTLRPGVGHLVHRSARVAVLPLALEYAYWEERFPEALVRFGDVLAIEDGSVRSADEWTAEIARRLEYTQDLLAADAVARKPEVFEVLLGGSAGIGGVYDFWRAAKARLKGEVFQRAHGREQL